MYVFFGFWNDDRWPHTLGNQTVSLVTLENYKGPYTLGNQTEPWYPWLDRGAFITSGNKTEVIHNPELRQGAPYTLGNQTDFDHPGSTG